MLDHAGMTATAGKFDEEAGGDYDPDLYAITGIAETDQVGVDPLPAALLDRYAERGYLSIERAIGPEVVADGLDGIDRLLAGVPGFRGVQWEARAREALPGSTPEQRRDWVRKLIYYVDHEPRLHAIAYDSALLAIVEQILGAPPVLFADQALLKPSGYGREKPWHQDKAFFDIREGAPVVGVWIALDDAVVENGCIHVIPGSHRDGPVVHFKRRDFQICDTDLERGQTIAVPLTPGSLMVFDGLLKHGTPANLSDKRRWALQFHYAREDDIWRTPEERRAYKEQRLAIYGAEGKDAVC